MERRGRGDGVTGLRVAPSMPSSAYGPSGICAHVILWGHSVMEAERDLWHVGCLSTSYMRLRPYALYSCPRYFSFGDERFHHVFSLLERPFSLHEAGLPSLPSCERVWMISGLFDQVWKEVQVLTFSDIESLLVCVSRAVQRRSLQRDVVTDKNYI